MAGVTRSIQNQLVELDSQVRGSLQEWTSDAREAYNVSKATWDAAAAKLPEALSRAEHALGEITSSYNQAEKAGANMWSGA
jgi:WXG100 family type VII secretion target